MPATTEQWDEIQALKGAHKAQLEAFDRECNDKRFEIERSHDEAFNDLYRRMGARRQREDFSRRPSNQQKGEQDGTSP
jgi:hypothetical protein